MERVYFPILKAKEGELNAIKELSTEIRAVIMPVFRLTNPTQQRNKPPKIVDKKFVRELAIKINESTYGMPYVLDTSLIRMVPELERLMISYLTSRDLFSVPEFYPLININHDARLYQSCLDTGYIPKKVCLKLSWQNIDNPNTQQHIQQIMDSMGVDEASIVLLLDLEDVSAVEVEKVADPICSFYQNIKSIFSFDTLILGAGAFPASLAGMKPWQIKYIGRRDWKLFSKISNIVEGINYSDYAINTAVYSEGSGFSGPSNIRYTTNEYFAIVKAVKPDIVEEDETTKEQYRRLSELIVESDFYEGHNYSWGDEHIYNCTQPLNLKNGNATTWRAVGTSHHIAHVVEALSKPLSPLVSL